MSRETVNRVADHAQRLVRPQLSAPRNHIGSRQAAAYSFGGRLRMYSSLPSFFSKLVGRVSLARQSLRVSPSSTYIPLYLRPSFPPDLRTMSMPLGFIPRSSL